MTPTLSGRSRKTVPDGIGGGLCVVVCSGPPVFRRPLVADAAVRGRHPLLGLAALRRRGSARNVVGAPRRRLSPLEAPHFGGAEAAGPATEAGIRRDHPAV